MFIVYLLYKQFVIFYLEIKLISKCREKQEWKIYIPFIYTKNIYYNLLIVVISNY